MADSVTITCDCGHSMEIHREPNGEFEVCGIECPKCDRHSTGGNYRSGEVSSWITARAAAESEREYAAQCFSADMNEWYGRGNHPF